MKTVSEHQTKSIDFDVIGVLGGVVSDSPGYGSKRIQNYPEICINCFCKHTHDRASTRNFKIFFSICSYLNFIHEAFSQHFENNRNYKRVLNFAKSLSVYLCIEGFQNFYSFGYALNSQSETSKIWLLLAPNGEPIEIPQVEHIGCFQMRFEFLEFNILEVLAGILLRWR